jgi:hypothetical protein
MGLKNPTWIEWTKEGNCNKGQEKGVEVTISLQTSFIYLCMCVFAWALWSLVLLCFNKRQVSLSIWESSFRKTQIFLLIGSWNFYPTEIIAFCHFKKLAGVKPSWCTLNLISLLTFHTLKSFSLHWDYKANHSLKTKWALEACFNLVPSTHDFHYIDFLVRGKILWDNDGCILLKHA